MVVQCTWKSAEGRDVGDAVSWTSAEENQAGDVEEEVQAENCLLLVAPNESSSDFLASPACQLFLSCHPTEQIQYISILSDARVMEVYGHHGEYIKTIRNELIEEVEDMAVFKGDVMLDRPLNVCSIKFACLRSKTEMWLYGVKVNLSKKVDQGEGLPIQFAEVEQRLNMMGLSLSDKAKAFKELVEARHPNFSGLSGQDLNALISLLQISSTNKDIQDLPKANNIQSIAEVHTSSPDNINNAACSHNNGADITNLNNNSNNNKPADLCSSETQTMDPPPPSIEDVLKLHIDQKLEELHTQMWEKIHKRFQEIETKLMCKLDEVESFVKPQGV